MGEDANLLLLWETNLLESDTAEGNIEFANRRTAAGLDVGLSGQVFDSPGLDNFGLNVSNRYSPVGFSVFFFMGYRYR